VGSTQKPVQIRCDEHNNQVYEKKYTAVTNDWAVFLCISCDNIKEARAIEQHIKRMKSRVYIENLLKYPEIIKRLKEKYT